MRFASGRAPPTLLLQGLDDTVVAAAQAQEMHDALQSHGIRVEIHFYPQRSHADTIAAFSLAARVRTPTLNETLSFLRRVTAGDASSRGLARGKASPL